MIAPCENPISTVCAAPTPLDSCQRVTASTNDGMAAAMRAGRLASVTPATENHSRPEPEDEGWAASTLTTIASGG